MLIRMFTSGYSFQQILLQLLLFVPVLLLVLSVHEMSHALMAYALGDKSQKAEGRMTLNPLRHIDPLGTLMLLLVGFGWAKPVYVNSAALKRGGKYAGALVSAAGPLSNFILAWLFTLGQNAILISHLYVGSDFKSSLMTVLYLLCRVGHDLSIGLGIFNLIPVPPLDGFGVISPFLPRKIYYFIMAHSREISMIFLLLLILTRF